jgi:CRISPR-associated exonuclease Cas4
MSPVGEIALAVAGISGLVLLTAIAAWISWVPDRRHGHLVDVDLPGRTGTRLVSERWRLVGRPDEIRQLPDGSWIPVEWKSRSTPRSGPWRSHQIQVAAYCLLVEETTGRAPPYGIVRYGDGGEFFVAWDAGARASVAEIRREVARPYDGRATPSTAKCARCRWRAGCDARAA